VKVGCCRAKPPKAVGPDTVVRIPEIIAGEVDVLPADRGKVCKQSIRDDLAASNASLQGSQKCRLRVDTSKWTLARTLPQKYGDLLRHTGPDAGPDAVRGEVQRTADRRNDGRARRSF